MFSCTIRVSLPTDVTYLVDYLLQTFCLTFLWRSCGGLIEEANLRSSQALDASVKSVIERVRRRFFCLSHNFAFPSSNAAF